MHPRRWPFHLALGLLLAFSLGVYVYKGFLSDSHPAQAEGRIPNQHLDAPGRRGDRPGTESLHRHDRVLEDVVGDVDVEVLVALGFRRGPGRIVGVQGTPIHHVREYVEKTLQMNPRLESIDIGPELTIGGLQLDPWELTVRFRTGAQLMTRNGDIYRYVDGRWCVEFCSYCGKSFEVTPPPKQQNTEHEINATSYEEAE